MPHDHGHGSHRHHHVVPEAGDRKVALAIAVNLLLTVAQIVGGLISGSVALIADAVHNLSDAVSLIIAFVARRIARRPADGGMSFGYGRAELVAALVNYTTLVVISVWLGYEGTVRLLDPPEVAGGIVIVLAALALAIDLVTAALTWRLSKESANIRAAFLHNLADAATSVAVIIGGVLIWVWDWRLADPLITLGIAGWILWQALVEAGPVIRILMLGAPPEMEADELRRAMEGEAGVEEVHHLHLWQMDERRTSVEAHLVLADGADFAEVVHRVKRVLTDRFGVSHSTLEPECRTAGCADAARSGSTGR
ncbi:Cadmium, cobalt and zinc/H(+)-K(+) antiporter [Defluviimonas aquaemixtae]|uniref:Cadmium, cobalt and zinc/H(+)-K(+) antiporter n=1 Tax=Albidovulum aquaemixtae TaxID=1542388 RepID=A0A2R8B2A0_9RHOB|nr:cation diffusion facilitator family transporter [Defluviimonas aquaemixtae]SPH16670.1 Cadmium, cobalt and zinc/H(+)-K(+) antiporter [Defluviimonas aquaemixtae]